MMVCVRCLGREIFVVSFKCSFVKLDEVLVKCSKWCLLIS